MGQVISTTVLAVNNRKVDDYASSPASSSSSSSSSEGNDGKPRLPRRPKIQYIFDTSDESTSAWRFPPIDVLPDERSFLLDEASKYLKKDLNWLRLNLSERILPHVAVREFPSDTIIFREGDSGNSMYLVESGKLRVTASDGSELFMASTGSILGDCSLFFNLPRRFTVTSVEKCRLWHVTRHGFSELQRELQRPKHLKHSSRFLDVPEVSALGGAFVEKLLSQVAITEHKKDSLLVCQGKCNTKVIVIESGVCDIYMPDWFFDLDEDNLLRILGISVDFASIEKTADDDAPKSWADVFEFASRGKFYSGRVNAVAQKHQTAGSALRESLSSITDGHGVRDRARDRYRSRIRGTSRGWTVVQALWSRGQLIKNLFGRSPPVLSKANSQKMRPKPKVVKDKEADNDKKKEIEKGKDISFEKPTEVIRQNSLPKADGNDDGAGAEGVAGGVAEAASVAVDATTRDSVILASNAADAIAAAAAAAIAAVAAAPADVSVDTEATAPLPPLAGQAGTSPSRSPSLPPLSQSQKVRKRGVVFAVGDVQDDISQSSSTVSVKSSLRRSVMRTPSFSAPSSPRRNKAEENGAESGDGPKRRLEPINRPNRAISNGNALMGNNLRMLMSMAVANVARLPSLEGGDRGGESSASVGGDTGPSSAPASSAFSDQLSSFAAQLAETQSPNLTSFPVAGPRTTKNLVLKPKSRHGSELERPSTLQPILNSQSRSEKFVRVGGGFDVVRKDTLAGKSAGAGAGGGPAEGSPSLAQLSESVRTSLRFPRTSEPFMDDCTLPRLIEMKLPDTADKRRGSTRQWMLRVGPGTVLGIGTLSSLLRHVGSEEWKDEVKGGVPQVGAVSQITAVVASEIVEAAHFTTFDFEKLFGARASALSTTSFHGSSNMEKYFSKFELVDGKSAAVKDIRMEEEVGGLGPLVSHTQTHSSVAKQLLRSGSSRLYLRRNSYEDVMKRAEKEEVVAFDAAMAEEFSPDEGPASLSLACFKHERLLEETRLGVVLHVVSCNPPAIPAPTPAAPTAKAKGNEGNVRKHEDLKSDVAATAKPVAKSSPLAPGREYVLKIFGKAKAVKENIVASVVQEAKVLSSEAGRHPFVAQLKAKFQTLSAVVLVFEYLPRGDLWDVLNDFVVALGSGKQSSGRRSALLHSQSSATSPTRSSMSMGLLHSPSFVGSQSRSSVSVGVSRTSVSGASPSTSTTPAPAPAPSLATSGSIISSSGRVPICERKHSSAFTGGPPRQTRYLTFGEGDAQLAEDLVKFYVASMVLALGHLHKHEIAFRNLKPENIVVDENGYVKLVGFGLSKAFPYVHASCGELLYRTFTVCGTVEYMAPEMILLTGHNQSVDTWALGVLLCELLTGRTPFAYVAETLQKKGGQHRVVRLPNAESKIMAAIAETQYTEMKFPNSCNNELNAVPGAMNLVRQLMCPLASARPEISWAKGSAIHNSEFFSGFDWLALRNLTMRAPYLPRSYRAKTDSMNVTCVVRHPPEKAAAAVKKSKSRREKNDEDGDEPRSPWNFFTGDPSMFAVF